MTQSELKKKATENATEMQRSVLVLVLALTVVVSLSIALFQNPPSADSTAAHAIQAPRNQYAELMAQARDVFRKTGDSKKAEELFRQAYRIDQNSSEALDAIGQMALIDGRPEEAYKHFQMADALSPGVARYEADMAIALLSMDREREAGEVAARGIKRFGAPRHEFALIQACVAQKQGNAERADALVKEVHDLVGADLVNTVRLRSWAKPLTESEAYREIEKLYSLPEYVPKKD